MNTSALLNESLNSSKYRDLVHINKRNRNTKQYGLLKASAFLFICMLLYLDLFHVTIINRLFQLPEFCDYGKYIAAGVLMILSVGHVISYIGAHIVPDEEVDDCRAKLLKINKDDLGFKVKPDVRKSPLSQTGSPSIEKLPYGSFCLPSAQNSFNDSFNSTAAVGCVTSTSWQFQSGMSSPSTSWKASPAVGYEKLLSKCRYPNARALDWHIEDEASADAYLREKSKENSLLGLSFNEDLDTSGLGGSPKKTNIIDTSVEAIQRLFSAQPYKASPITEPEKQISKEATPSAIVLRRWNIDDLQLFRWNEKLRIWLHKVIFVPLRDTIEELNQKVVNLGYGKDSQIGVASTAQLKHLSLLKSNILVNLESIIPFLEVSVNQAYVVQRIKDFSNCGALSEFRWNNGGSGWNDQIPTDAEILVHMFCCFMDSRLPPDPEYPDGKQFTKQHFKNSVNEPKIEVTNSGSIMIHQTKRNPPHFQLQIKEHVWDLGNGSNNSLHSLILFLYYHKKKMDGMICKMNMGYAGMNVLQIIED